MGYDDSYYRLHHKVIVMYPIAAVINHLLAQSPKDLDKLSVHRGKIALIDAGIAIRLQVDELGYVKTVDDSVPAQVMIKIKPSDLPLVLGNLAQATSYVTIEGDADFANAISQLTQTLRWDAEDDLSKVIGDIPAVKVVSGVRHVTDSVKNTAKKLAENTAEYLTEENPVLVSPVATSSFAKDVVKLRDDIERLTKRIERLEKQ